MDVMDTRAPAPLRRRAVRLAQGALYWGGLLQCLPSRGSASVLMYHSVATPDVARYVDFAWRMSADAFERQVRFFARRRRVVSLGALAGELKAGISPRPGTVVLTFDDGYRDNLEVAAPILRRYGLPAAIFLATAYVARGENQWVDRLYWALLSRTRHRLELAGAAGTAPLSLELHGSAQWRRAYAEIGRLLLESRYEEREPILRSLEAQLRPAARLPRLTLNWDEVRELHRRYPEFEIGVHSAHHVDLAAAGADAVREELSACIADVEREIGVRPRHFSFPYGRSSAAACRLVAEAGLDSAMGPSGLWAVEAQTDRYSIPRFNALMSATQLRLRTHPGFRSLPGWFASRG